MPTSEYGLAASVTGAIGYVVAIALPDNATGFWGVVCDVLTLWGWGLWTSLGLAALFAALMLVRAPRWLVTPLTVTAFVAAAPILVVVFLASALLSGTGGGSSGVSGEF